MKQLNLNTLISGLLLFTFVGFKLTGADVAVKLDCPLNDGSGKIITCTPAEFKGRVESAVNGIFPEWKNNELHFFGNKGYGVVKIPGGGELLSGAAFKINLEVKPTVANTSGYLVACKAFSMANGGFHIYYWAANSTLSFGFADGKEKYFFDAKLKAPLNLNEWHALEIGYDGSVLKMLLNGNVVFSEKKPGMILAKSRLPLCIGNYVNEIPDMFTGSICNVKLSIPEIDAEAEGVVKVNRGMPEIDGKLDDDVWRQAKFSGNFKTNADSRKNAVNATSFAVAADRENIYVAVRCAIDPKKGLKFEKRDKDNELLWEDDSVEIFILPWGTDHCIQLAANPGGSQADALLQYNLTQRRAEFDMDWQAATSVEGNEWTTEFAIPYAQILAPPNGGNVWRFNVCRTDQAQNTPLLKYSSYGQLPPGEKFTGFADDRIFSVLSGVPEPDYTEKQKDSVARLIAQSGVDKMSSKSPFAMSAAAPFMYIANNMIVPNVILTPSGSGSTILKEKSHIRFRFDLPEGISLLYAGLNRKAADGQYEVKKSPEPIMRDGERYTRYILTPIHIHHASNSIPLFLKSALESGAERKMYFSSAWSGGSQNWESIPLKTMEFPTPGMPKGIVASYAWIAPAYINTWPDCIETLSKLGFNTLPLHVHHPGVSDEEITAMATKARELGMKILTEASPFYHVRMNPEGNSTGIDGKPLPDVKDACPAYRGTLYQADLVSTENFTRLLQPDYFQFDIEQFSLGAHNALTGNCRRCAEIIKANPARKPEDVVTDMGTQIALDLYNSIKRGMKAGNKLPESGLYHTIPGGFAYENVFDQDKMLKAGAVQLAHPVYYGYSGAVAGAKTREYRNMPGNLKIFPWVTNGYDNFTPPETNYDMTLNVYGSGAQGMYWYGLERIEAADFYFYAKAMETINPVSEILAESEAFEVKYSAPEGIAVTGLKNRDVGILLVAAAGKTAPAGNITVELPKHFSGKIWSLPDQKAVAEINSGKTTFEFVPSIPGVRTAWYFIGEKPPLAKGE